MLMLSPRTRKLFVNSIPAASMFGKGLDGQRGLLSNVRWKRGEIVMAGREPLS